MKNRYLYFTLLLVVLVFLSSCGKDSFDESLPENPVLVPIKSVTAQDGPLISEGVISDKNRTIEMEFFNISSLEAVELHLKISKRAKLFAPLDTIVTLDLREPQEIVINNLLDDLTYTLTATLPEYILCDKSQFKEYRLDNDGYAQEKTNILNLWDNQALTVPEDYSSVGWRNYLIQGSFTVDLGTRFDGSYYKLKQFKANLYWAYTNVCPKVYELWGYMKEGEPPLDGNWDNWTKLATIDNSQSGLDSFGDGDNVYFDRENSPAVRYIRVNCIESYKKTNHISLSEITFWGWNK